jgi:hypothetical protein
MTQMRLRFSASRIRELSQGYVADMRLRDKRLTGKITKIVFPSYKRRGYLTRDEFLTVCAWKTPRTKPLCKSNDARLIQEVSSLARTTSCEQLRIQVWTRLAGVGWPTASVFLHFAFPGRYPILDFRALWSLSTDVPSHYTFDFWHRYSGFCRDLASQSGVSLRVLDQARWKYSEMHQPPRRKRHADRHPR